MDRHLETKHGISRKRKLASRRKAYHHSQRQRYAFLFLAFRRVFLVICCQRPSAADLFTSPHLTRPELCPIILLTDVNDLMLTRGYIPLLGK
jgi:hypothetical protein